MSDSKGDSKAKAPTIEGLTKTWSEFAPLYRDYYEPATSCVGRTIAAALKLHQAKAVIEVGAGPGSLSADVARLLFSTPRSADAAAVRYVVTDLAPDMVAVAAERCAEWKQVEVKVANAQELAYGDAAFDRYIANLSLMIVPDPDLMLKEAFRVLRPGGYAGFSIWGDDGDASPLVTLVPKLMAAMSPPVVATTRSNFHLSREGLPAVKARFAKAGFTGLFVTFHQQIVEALSAEDYVNKAAFHTPHTAALLNDVSAAQMTELRAATLKAAQAILDSGRAITMDTIVIIVQKPLASGATSASATAASAT